MALAVVRDLRSELRLETNEEIAAFEQDLLAEFVLARASAGELSKCAQFVGGELLRR
ncbi:hypothetical protein [Streptomyces hesseae]|uniref:Uncharacterized protein n=1 Tax=Streptomyces hesseae TaxID=3075519 RepID=A0ABU2SWV1_9ACTN|nr:hypothetical protein [Streptomyces sp. DSM 40473]MDT0453106.1 hypothetical protein [Streptomyces sp. DSM 40473]